MQNKGFVKVIAILLALVCVYYLSFSAVSRKYENAAQTYAQGDNAKYNAFMDSVSNEKALDGYFFGYTVKECREKELGLGLDLKGGMNVVMEVSVPDILRALAGEAGNKPEFQKSIAGAIEAQKSSQSQFLDLFIDQMAVNATGKPLANYFSNRNSKNQIKKDATDAQVRSYLADNIDAAIENSFNVLRSRIDQFGVVQPNIQRLTGSSRVLIEMPGVKEPARVRKLLQGSANLEFWETSELSEVFNNFVSLNDRIRELNKAAKPANETVATTADTTPKAQADSASGDLLGKLQNANTDTTDAVNGLQQQQWQEQNPLFAILNMNVNPSTGGVGQGPTIGYALGKDTAKINEYLAYGSATGILPYTLMPRWTIKPENGEYYALVALYAKGMKNKPRKAPLTGEVVTDAKSDFEQGKVYASVSMEMNTEGAKQWADLTRNNIGKCVAIVLDGYVYSYPRVNDEISGGRSSITGNFTPEEAGDLANVLKSGKMPAPAKIVQEDIVGPSLGQTAITNGFISFIVAFLMILVYMVFYYGWLPGLVADTALLFNVLLIFGVQASFGAVLTLPGIAGIVLTLGMAVDANVLIYERTREELRNGYGVKEALSKGYSNALSAIIDSNLTTILTGVILFFFGTGPIKGFATTLIIGILSSMFTAILVSRVIFEWLLSSDKYNDTKFTTEFTKNWFQNINFDFIGKAKTFATISLAVIAVSAISLFNKLKPSIDFTGGRNYVVRFENDVNPDEIRNVLSNQFENVSVITIGASNQVRVSTNYKIDEDGTETDNEIESMLYNGLKDRLNAGTTRDQFVSRYVVNNGVSVDASINDSETFGIQSSAKVGPTMAFDILRNAIIAVILALIGIGLYILIRFRDIAFSLGSVIALTHDTFIIIGIFSLCWKFMPFSMEVDQQFIAAILTVIGYSINDKVVIFDRIREFRALYPGQPQAKIFNNAICSTLSRTFSTSISTLLVLVIIFIFGGEVIRGFIFAMLLGVIIGTYSSIFIAAPIAHRVISRNDEKKANEKKEEKAEASTEA